MDSSKKIDLSRIEIQMSHFSNSKKYYNFVYVSFEIEFYIKILLTLNNTHDFDTYRNIYIFSHIINISRSLERERILKILIASLLHPFVTTSKNTMLYFCNRFFEAARQERRRA